jgi:hypothetical protein
MGTTIPMTESAPPDIYYIDHSVFMTLDLDGAAARYQALGFTLSPASQHMGSATPGGQIGPIGTSNQCAYFGQNYIELLGFDPGSTLDPWHVRHLVEQYEGLHGVMVGCGDADEVVRRLNESGIANSGVLSLERDVDTPEGTRTARFRSVAPQMELGGNLRVAQHLTPEYIHQERYLTHANGASELTAVLLVVADDELEDYVRTYGAVLGVGARTDGPRRILQLQLGRIEIVGASALDEVLPGETPPDLPFWAAQSVTVAEVDAARALVEGNGIPTHSLPGGGFVVRAADAFGTSSVGFLGR